MQINHGASWRIVLECFILKILCHQIYGAVREKYLLACKSENIAPTPWALGSGGENRNRKCPGPTELCDRNPWGGNHFRTPFPRTESGLALFGVKLILILKTDFHSCAWLGNWESCCFPWGKPWGFLFPPSQILRVPLDLGSPFFGFCFLGNNHEGIGAAAGTALDVARFLGLAVCKLLCFVV